MCNIQNQWDRLKQRSKSGPGWRRLPEPEKQASVPRGGIVFQRIVLFSIPSFARVRLADFIQEIGDLESRNSPAGLISTLKAFVSNTRFLRSNLSLRTPDCLYQEALICSHTSIFHLNFLTNWGEVWLHFINCVTEAVSSCSARPCAPVCAQQIEPAQSFFAGFTSNPLMAAFDEAALLIKAWEHSNGQSKFTAVPINPV